MHTKDVQLVAIVNSFNRLSLLQEALASLCKALAELSFETAVVIFEGGSRDGSVEWVKTFFQQQSRIQMDLIQTDPSSQDSSLSTGVNAACDHAAAKFSSLKSSAGIFTFPNLTVFFLFIFPSLQKDRLIFQDPSQYFLESGPIETLAIFNFHGQQINDSLGPLG